MTTSPHRPRVFTWVLPVLAATLVALSSQSASAQYGSSRSMYQATRNFMYNRPTVSPYLNLTTRDSSVGLSNYFTLVRPQVEAQQQQQAMRQQQAAIQREISDVQNQVRQTQEQNQGLSTTGQMGWSARGYPRFGMYLSYYPGMNQIARRR